VAKRTASAKKQARSGARRTVRNRSVRSEVKTKVVKARRSFVESPVAQSDRVATAVDAIRALDRAAAKGILHRNNAARRKARLMRQLVKLGPIKTEAAPSATTGRGKRGAKAAPAPPPAPAKKTRK
jgi:small subunit ribosomal protein S20